MRAVANELLIRFRDGHPASGRSAWHRRFGVSELRYLPELNLSHVRLSGTRSMASALKELSATPAVLAVLPNLVMEPLSWLRMAR